MKEEELEALLCPKGSLLCENYDLLFGCLCLASMVVSRYLMCLTQLPSLNLSLRYTACFCVYLLLMERAERIGLLLLLLSLESREDGM